MESIKLTKEQKDKLIEMSKSLFPEWFDISWGKGNYQDERDYIWFYEKWVHPETKNEIPSLLQTIHWFEFCFNNLYKKLKEKVYLNNGAFYNLFLENTNPIDYLYEEFKRINNK